MEDIAARLVGMFHVAMQTFVETWNNESSKEITDVQRIAAFGGALTLYTVLETCGIYIETQEHAKMLLSQAAVQLGLPEVK